MLTRTFLLRTLLVMVASLAVVFDATAGYTSKNDPHGFPPGCNVACSGAGGSSGGVGGAAGGTGGGAGGGVTPGMPVYSISPMLISLTMRDTPLSYHPAVGPAMDFSLSYNQLDIDQPNTFTYGNVGPKWTYNWLGYVQDDPSALGSNRTLVYLPGGPGRLYSGYNGSTGAFSPEPETGAQLVLVSKSPVVYERRFPDGRKDVFSESDDSAQYPRRIFLTQRIDAHGNAVSLTYDDQHRLTQVADANGHALTFDYTDADHPLEMTAVHDSFGRSIALGYDAQGRLAGVTDAIGMHSAFGYDGGTNITSLTTPYGTTRFASHQSGTRRWIDVTDANGNTSRMEFNQAVSGVPFSESQVPQGVNAYNLYINSRDSFFWDAEAFRAHAGDYSKAVIYHWNHKYDNGHSSSVTSDSLESIKYPLESRIWYNHPGDLHGVSGALNMPSVVARILPDGSTQITRNTYNAIGRLVRSIDPTGLETDYTYAPNQIDVLKIERSGPDGYQAQETFTYNDQHEVLTHTDETGATTTKTYNATGQVLTVTDASGGVTRYTYDDAGNKTSMTDANGHTTNYGYDAQGRMIRMTDPLGRTTQYAYDALNRLVRTTYPDGSYQEVTWDKLDRGSVRDRNGHVTTYTHDALQHRTSETDALGNTTKWTYYANGLMKSRTDANGHTTTWQRDLEGRVTAITDANGASTRFVYDTADRRIRSTNALGQVTNYTYDHNDRPTRSVDPNGIATDLSYTSRGWLAQRMIHARTDGAPSADDATTTFDYNARGDRIAITDPDGVKTAYTYDAVGRLVAIDDALGNTEIAIYDAVGNLLAKADSVAGTMALSRLHSYNYDAANQRDGSIDADGQTTSYRYDVAGHLRDTRDPLGVHTVSVFDAEGQLIKMIEGQRKHGHEGRDHEDSWSGEHRDEHRETGHEADQGDEDHGRAGHGHDASALAVTHYAYDAANRLVTVTDPNQLVTRYIYDAVGQKVQQISPDTGTTQYAYDAVGNEIRKVDARGVETDQSFDALKRITGRRYPSDTSLDVAFRYDEPDSVTGCASSFPVGRLTRMDDASGSTTYCYNAQGKITQIHRVISGHNYAVSFAWTPGNRLSSLIYPSGTVAYYHYDAVGRVSGIDIKGPTDSTPETLVSEVSYLPFGPVGHMKYGQQGLVLTRTYDGNYRGTDIEGLGLDLHVRRDANGNIVQLRNEKGHGPLTERYRYDDLQRLTQVIGPYGWFNSRYTYNATGDRLSKHEAGGLPVWYRYEAGTHRLSDIAAPGFSKRKVHAVLTDANGNVVQMPRNDTILSLVYGSDNRLRGSSTSTGNETSYLYDGNGLRAEKETKDPVSTRDFLYSGWHLLGEYVQQTGDKREYVWMGDMLVSSSDNVGSANASIHYVATDFLDSPRSVTDDRGHVVWRWAYEGNPFGDRPAVGEYPFNLRFSGQYYDTESGLAYNLNRDYDPSLGRYVEPDPLGFRGGNNLFAYVNSNPIVSDDPWGLCKSKGKWVQVGWIRGFNVQCYCTWIWLAPHMQAVWSGNPQDLSLPRTSGRLVNNGFGGLKRGNGCACAPPPPPKDVVDSL